MSGQGQQARQSIESALNRGLEVNSVRFGGCFEGPCEPERTIIWIMCIILGTLIGWLV